MKKETYQDKLDHKMELVRSQMTKDPLNGIIVGLFERNIEGRNVFFAQISYGPCSVVIPEDKFKEGLAERDRPYVAQLMKSRIGTRAYFVVEQYDEDSNSAVGNSILANEKRRKLWFKKAEDGDYELREGKEVTGHIVAIRQRALIVDVSGVESHIPAKFVTYKRVNHMAKLFGHDQSIKLVLTQITRDEEANTVKFVADHKRFEENPAEKFFDQYVVPSVRMGEVTSLMMYRDQETGDITGFAVYVQTSDGVSVRCKPSYGATPQEGQMATFKLVYKEKKEDGKIVFGGKILHLHR